MQSRLLAFPVFTEGEVDAFAAVYFDPGSTQDRLFDHYLRTHRNAAGLIQRGESKTLELKSTLRWNLKEGRKDDKRVTHAVLKTIAAFLNTEGGDLLIGVADDGSVLGLDADRLDNDDKYMRHLAQAVRNAMGDRAGTCIDPTVQRVDGKTVCVVACQRSPEPVFLKWKGLEKTPEGDFYVRSGPGTVKLGAEDTREYVRTRFGGRGSVDAGAQRALGAAGEDPPTGADALNPRGGEA